MADVTIVGAGALGSILAGLLLGEGHRVNLLCRGARAQQLSQDGLVVSGLADIKAPLQPVTRAEDIAHCGVLVFAVKTYHMQQALADTASLKPELAFSLANGIAKTGMLAGQYGAGHTLGCVADFSGELLDSGEVIYTRNNGLYLGEASGGRSERVDVLVSLLNASGLKTLAPGDIRSEEWAKFLAWLPVFVLSVLTRQNTAQFLVDEGCAQLAQQIIIEAAQLARRESVQFYDRSLLPSASLLAQSPAQAVATVIETGRALAKSAPEHRMSSLQDLDRGKPLELHETLGYVLAEAGRAGLDTPALRMAFQLINAIDPARSRA